jgi:hypothetical protein
MTTFPIVPKGRSQSSGTTVSVLALQSATSARKASMPTRGTRSMVANS